MTQGILVIFFAVLAYQILKRRRQRINLIFSGFFLCIIVGFIFNMCYAAISPVYADVIIFLHFLSIFFVYFGLIFILIVNLIILESTVIFSIKRQNRFIVLFGVILFFGMLILILIPDPLDIIGVDITASGRPGWKPLFFAYMISVISGFAIIPIIYTSFKIYFRFETKALKRKWLFYLVGSLGLILCNLYPVHILNLLTHILPEENLYLISLRSILSILSISVIVWALFMYYGIGAKLKK
ncbi:MAG: hypothetical protein ACFE9Z_09810 [Promethearchaeota archaeon]